jgi:anthranilate phosphoribosyltransferase
MAAPVRARVNGEPLLDTCGTGGDGGTTFNVSTVAAFVAAGAGARVAKHGNRSISSRCGSADLLEAFGINLGVPPERSAAAIAEVGIGFFFAPAVHTAMRHAQPVRAQLKLRTVFNLLGPLTNPAGATAQLVGAPSERAAELMAGALSALGLERGFVVHACDGFDEITTTGPTLAFEICRGNVERRVLHPADFGVKVSPRETLVGGDKERNCQIAREVLSGAPGPHRDIVLVNASAALVAAGKAPGFLEGVDLAARAIDSGSALAKAEALVSFTQRRDCAHGE